MRMRTIAIVNQKGGSGKTTTAVNLGAALAQAGRRVLLIDLDPQASASSWLGISDGEAALAEVFTNDWPLREAIMEVEAWALTVAPASMWLVGIEKALAAEVGAELILARKLAELEAGPEAERPDYALLDCPPALGLLTVNALAAADRLIIPVETHVMALGGLAQLLQSVELVRQRLNADLQIAGIVACRADFRTRHSREVIEQLRLRFGPLVYETVIRENIRLAEAPSFGEPIMTYAPGCAGAEDYTALAAEVIAQEP
jgi:chromosome partitioning protein